MTPQSPARTPASVVYTEWLRVSWWGWLGAFVFLAVMALEVLMGFPGVPAWIPFVVLVPLTVAGLLWTGRIKVTIDGDAFLVDDCRLPVDVISDVVPLDAAGKREALGVGAHPLAFVIQRPWIGPAVQVILDDPADPTPFWVISTRQPVELATALLAATDAASRRSSGA